MRGGGSKPLVDRCEDLKCLTMNKLLTVTRMCVHQRACIVFELLVFQLLPLEFALTENRERRFHILFTGFTYD